MMTLPDYFAANMELLQTHQPHVWQIFNDTEIEPTGKICRADDGSINIMLTLEGGTELPLHKTTAPASEADDFLAAIPADHTGFLALLGMGLGYAAMGILEKRPLIQHFAVFELEPGIFLQAIKYIDLAKLLKDPRLILGVGTTIPPGDVLAPAFRTLQLEGSNVLHHLQSFNYNPDGYKTLKEEVFNHLNAMNVGGNTTKALGRNFFTNRFKHINCIHHHLLLEGLAQKFTGTPAILVAGGPSLDKNIHLLKEAQDRAIILAVDTVLPALLAHGITPHFITSIDPNNLTYEKFADVIPMAHDISLICSSWVNPKTPQNFPASQVFWTFTQKPMEAWLNTLLCGTLFTSGASTVAHLNLIATDILGCDPVIFVGQDLAYPQTASHAQGTVLQGSSPSTDLQSAEAEGQTVRGIDGSILRTNRSFLSMKGFFEGAIANSDKKFINATEGGAHIEGTLPLTLRETLAEYCKEKSSPGMQIKEYIKTAAASKPDKMLNTFSKTIKEAGKLKKIIQDADHLCRQISAEHKKNSRAWQRFQSYKMLPPKIQQKLQKIDNLHKKLDASWIWRLLEELTMAGLQESERARQAIATLADDPTRYLDWLEQNLARLLKINAVRKNTLALLTENLNRTLAFHKQEKNLLKKIASGKDAEQNRLQLARLYMDGDYYSLAAPLLEELQTTMPQCGEVFFSFGCVKTLRSEFNKAAEYFTKATTIEPALAEKVDEFHTQLGDEFMGYAEYFKRQPDRRQSIIYMLKKGLRFAPKHEEILVELKNIISEDMTQGESILNSGKIKEAKQLISPWHDFIVEQKDTAANLPPELVSQIFLNQGLILIKENEPGKAIDALQKGLAYSPTTDALHQTLIEILFATGDFNGTITALNRAVSINIEFAAYWESIGDSLLANGQGEDAIIAYERCFTLQPENSSLIKKIGDCYRSVGQLEAAKESYEQFKNKIENSDLSASGRQ